MRLSILWRIMELQEGVIRRGRRPRRITPSEISMIAHLHYEVTWPMLPLNNELESCWCQKSTERIKIILHPKFEMERIWGRFFMALWYFNKVVWFVLAAMLEGILLPSNMAAKTTFCLNLAKRLIVTLRYGVNVTTSSFQHAFKKKKITFWSRDHLRTYSF